MRFSTFRQMSHDEVVQTASRLFTALGADPGHNQSRHEEWLDESLKGQSAVYETLRGYRLGSPDSHLDVRISEKWSTSGNSAISSAVDVKAHGGIDLSVRYRHGQLQCLFAAKDEQEEACVRILDQL